MWKSILSRIKFSMIFPFIIVLIAVALFINPLIHTRNILYFSDVIHVWYFFKLFVAKCLQKYGELPLWNPLIYSGVPFAGNPQSTMFYPLYAIFYFIPVHYAITLTYVIHFAIAGIGAYLFARMKNISYAGSVLAAVIVMLNWKLFGHAFAGHMTIVCTYAYTPWLFIGGDYLFKKHNFGAAAFISVCLALSFLCGSPQIFYYQFLIFFAYFVFLLSGADKKSAVRTSFVFCGAFVLFLLLSAIYYLPVYEVMQNSQREGGTRYLFATTYSLAWRELITLFFPHFFVVPQAGSNITNNFFWETAVYMGIAPLFLAIFGFRTKEKKVFCFFAGFFVFTVLFSLGSNTPFFKMLYYIVPGIKYFRCPARIFLFGEFAIAILAAMGLDFITKNRGESQLPARIGFSMAVVLAVVCSVSNFVYGYKIHGAITALALIIFLSAIFVLFFNGKIKTGLFVLSIIAVSLFDYFRLNYPLIKSVPVHEIKPRGDIYKQLINGDFSYRIMDLTMSYPQFASAWLWTQQLGSCDGVMIGRYLHYLLAFYNNMPYPNRYKPRQTYESFPVGKLDTDVNWKLIDLLNTKYLITPYPLNHDFLVEEGSYSVFEFNTKYLEGLYPIIYRNPERFADIRTHLYRNKNVLPRAFTVSNPGGVGNSGTLLDNILANRDINAVGEAKILVYQPNLIAIVAQLPEDGFLFTSEIVYPGWQVKVDGVKKEILPIKNIFRGVALDSGRHRILFEYKPKSYFYGLVLSICGIMVLCVGFTYMYLKRKFYNSAKNYK